MTYYLIYKINHSSITYLCAWSNLDQEVQDGQMVIQKERWMMDLIIRVENHHPYKIIGIHGQQQQRSDAKGLFNTRAVASATVHVYIHLPVPARDREHQTVGANHEQRSKTIEK